jgi:hypothetical protein
MKKFKRKDMLSTQLDRLASNLKNRGLTTQAKRVYSVSNSFVKEALESNQDLGTVEPTGVKSSGVSLPQYIVDEVSEFYGGEYDTSGDPLSEHDQIRITIKNSLDDAYAFEKGMEINDEYNVPFSITSKELNPLDNIYIWVYKLKEDSLIPSSLGRERIEPGLIYGETKSGGDPIKEGVVYDGSEISANLNGFKMVFLDGRRTLVFFVD